MRNALYFLFFILLLTSASADFNAFGETSLALLTCEQTLQELFIQNTEDSTQTFSISVDGTGSQFITFSTIAFELAAQKTAKIDAYYTIPCDTPPGNYPLDIYFTSQDSEKILSQTITVTRPETIKLTTDLDTQLIPLCGEATYNLTLQNPTNVTEHYELDLSGHKDAHLRDAFITLDPGTSQQLTVDATPQDCTQEGTFTLTVQVGGQQSLQTKKLDLTLNIQNTGVPEILAPTTTIRADFEQSMVQIPLKNTGRETTTYTLRAEGLEWITLQPHSITLRPGERTQLTILLTPPNIPEGSYPFTLAMELDNGVVYDADFSIKLGPPTFLERNPGLAIALGILGIALLAGIIVSIIRYNRPKARAKRQKHKEKRLKDKERHKQRKETARKIAKEKKRKEKERKLKEKEKKRAEKEKKRDQRLSKREKKQKRNAFTKPEKRAKVQITAEKRITTQERKEIEAEYEDKLQDKYHFIKKDRKQPLKKQTLRWILAIISILILMPLFYYAWDATLIGISALYVLFIILRIKRSYQITKKYTALTHQTNLKLWNKGLIRATLLPSKDIADFELLIKKTQPHIKQGMHYQTFTIQTNTTTKTTLSSNFKISKRWLKRHGILQDNLKIGKFQEHTWRKIPITYVGEDKHALYYTADLSSGTYTIHGIPEQKQSQMPILAILVGTALTITLLFATFTPQELTSIGIPPQTWQTGTQHQIHLANYFSDPDNDQLSFTATGTEHITIDIIEGKAILTPQPGWAGTEQVIFIAHDEKGGSAKSNTVSLTVRSGLINDATQPYVVTGLGIIALLILVLGFRGLQRKRV